MAAKLGSAQVTSHHEHYPQRNCGTCTCFGTSSGEFVGGRRITRQGLVLLHLAGWCWLLLTRCRDGWGLGRGGLGNGKGVACGT